MKAGGRKEAIREFKVSAVSFFPSVVLMCRHTRPGQPDVAGSHPGATHRQGQQKTGGVVSLGPEVNIEILVGFWVCGLNNDAALIITQHVLYLM